MTQWSWFEFKLIEWHDIRVVCYCFHARKRENRYFYARSMTSHEPRREWLIGNFSWLEWFCTFLRSRRGSFLFLRSHLSLQRHFLKPVAIKILHKIFACIITWDKMDFDRRFDGHAAGESHREALIGNFSTFLNLIEIQIVAVPEI